MQFTPPKYRTYPATALKPDGWLKQQLRIQAEGLSGNLDKMWSDIRDSRWIGGDCDGWERVPYWLDGFIPLAWLLDDKDLKARAKRYIDGILERQKPDGWICPCEDHERSRYDVWATFLICKVLVVYYECSRTDEWVDERIEDAVRRALHNLMLHIRGNTLFNWAAARWFEGLVSIYWLYDRTGEEWLPYLAHMLRVQGTGYRDLFDNWMDQEPHTDWNYQTHVVNLAMAIKSEVLGGRIGDRVAEGEAFAEKMLGFLQKYHGTAVGHFTGDENLAGDSPIQGTELCGVVEAMYSYEEIFLLTGNPVWLDRLETLAYNALPATTSPDMWTHQYDQMTNQMACVRFAGKPIFGTNNQEAHLFGLEPNYGCCTANFNQGWPKFAWHIFLSGEDSILSAALAPATVKTTIKDAEVEVSLDTLYPFRNSGKYTVKTSSPVCFALEVRIPVWAKNATLDGISVEAGKIARIERIWEGETTVELSMDFDIVFEERPRQMAALRRGPLYYSVHIDEEWKKYEYERHGVVRKYPYCDYEIYPRSPWNWAFGEGECTVTENEIVDYPFSSEHPPVEITAPLYQIDWGYEEGYNDLCAKVPHSREPISETMPVRMKPYGCTNLRMTELPK
ncbi:MAG: glycoside hydrolase family 127 protein [Clostridia bacterium]|nr:glycoside hydrolase family 127 protein [Clostridia bacterium]